MLSVHSYHHMCVDLSETRPIQPAGSDNMNSRVSIAFVSIYLSSRKYLSRFSSLPSPFSNIDFPYELKLTIWVKEYLLGYTHVTTGSFPFKVNNRTLVSINYYILINIRRVLQGRSGTYLDPLLDGRVRSDHGLTMMG